MIGRAHPGQGSLFRMYHMRLSHSLGRHTPTCVHTYNLLHNNCCRTRAQNRLFGPLCPAPRDTPKRSRAAFVSQPGMLGI